MNISLTPEQLQTLLKVSNKIGYLNALNKTCELSFSDYNIVYESLKNNTDWLKETLSSLKGVDVNEVLKPFN